MGGDGRSCGLVLRNDVGATCGLGEGDWGVGGLVGLVTFNCAAICLSRTLLECSVFRSSATSISSWVRRASESAMSKRGNARVLDVGEERGVLKVDSAEETEEES